MDVLLIQEILLADEIRIFDVPNAPKFLKGIINLRGTLAPIVNLGIKIGRPADVITDKSRVIVCKVGPAGVVGVLVDELAELVDADKPETDPITSRSDMPDDDVVISHKEEDLTQIITMADILGEGDDTAERSG